MELELVLVELDPLLLDREFERFLLLFRFFFPVVSFMELVSVVPFIEPVDDVLVLSPACGEVDELLELEGLV